MGDISPSCRRSSRLNLTPKALQVFHELGRNRQVTGVEAFNLVDTGVGILGEREDVYLALG